MRGIIIASLVLFSLFIASCQGNIQAVDVEYMTQSCLVPVKDNKFKLCDNMLVRVDNQIHVVPMGFKTDLASIPRVFWPVFSPGSYDSIAPAILHDWHYCCSKDVSRKTADSIFYASLRQHGMGKTQAFIYYLGVRLMGWPFYRNGDDLALHEKEFPKEELQGVYDEIELGCLS